MLESIKEHPVLTASVAAAVVGVATVGVRAYAYNSTESSPFGSCASPWAVAGPYQNPGASNFRLYTGFTKGAVIETQVPPDAHGVQGAWRHAGSGEQGWHASRMLPGTGKVAVKFGIGDGPVEFGLRAQAPSGSETCHTPLKTEIRVLGAAAFVTADGRCPWIIPLNALSCLR